MTNEFLSEQPGRLRNALELMGIRSPEDLKKFDMERFCYLPYIGEKTRSQMETLLTKHGLDPFEYGFPAPKQISASKVRNAADRLRTNAIKLRQAAAEMENLAKALYDIL